MVDEVRRIAWAKKALNAAQEECGARISHSCCRPLGVWWSFCCFFFFPQCTSLICQLVWWMVLVCSWRVLCGNPFPTPGHFMLQIHDAVISVWEDHGRGHSQNYVSLKSGPSCREPFGKLSCACLSPFPGWSVASRLQLASLHWTYGMRESVLPRSFWNFGGVGVCLTQHQGSLMGVLELVRPCSFWSASSGACSGWLLEPKEGQAFSSWARGTVSSLLLLFSNANITAGGLITDTFCEMGLNVCFGKNCHGIGWGQKAII